MAQQPSVTDLFGEDSDSDAPPQEVGGAGEERERQREEAAALFGSDSDSDGEAPPSGKAEATMSGDEGGTGAAETQAKKKRRAFDEEDEDAEEEEDPAAAAAARAAAAEAEALALLEDERDATRVEANGPPSLIKAERVLEPLEAGAKLQMVRFPNTLGVEPGRFDPATYVPQSEHVQQDATTGRRKIKLGAENVVRWRRTAGGEVESNARLVRWADGTVQLFVGGETLDMVEHPYEEVRTYLYGQVPRVGGGNVADASRRRSTRRVVEEPAGLAVHQARGLFVSRVAFQVAAGTKSKSHAKLKKRVKDMHFRGSRVVRTMQDVNEAELREEALRKQAQREKEQRDLRRSKEKVRQRHRKQHAPSYGYGGGGDEDEDDEDDADFLEAGARDDDEGSEAEYESSARKRGRDFGNVSDEEERDNRLRQAQGRGGSDSDGDAVEEEEEDEAGSGSDGGGVTRVRRAKKRRVLEDDSD